MVVERVTDGRRIAQLLASELRGHERGALRRCSVVDVQDVDGSEFGEFAYGVDVTVGEGDGREHLAAVYVHDDRTRVEFVRGVEAAVDAGREAGLRVRLKASDPPRTVVFVESGVEAKRVLAVFGAAVSADTE
jgi:hypothetical protein